MPHLSRPARLVVLVVIALLLGELVGADVLVLKDGQRYEGRLISRDDRVVVFEVHTLGGRVKAKHTFATDEVAEFIEEEISGAVESQASEETTEDISTYLVVPIEGVIGTDVTNALLEKALRIAQGAKPTVVVLEIDSPGGVVDELSSMLTTLKSYEELRPVAYVKQASSAAAVLAMSCPKIVMSEVGFIGGAVVYRLTPGGTPANIEEKMSSLLRAEFRAMVTHAGHDELLLMGMMQANITLSVMEEHGAKRVVEGARGKVIKRAGEILTVTGKEAVDCGLAVGTAETVADCHDLLGIDEWKQHTRRVTPMFAAWRKELKRVRGTFKQAVQEGIEATAEASGYLLAVLQGDDNGLQRCSRSLKRAEKRFRVARALAKRYPQLVYEPFDLEAAQLELRLLRKQMEAASGP